MHTGGRVFDFKFFSSQILYEGNCHQEDVNFEQEHCSFDRRHFLEYGVQNGDPGREGYTNYTHYNHYTDYSLLHLLYLL
jgi:hypothetical protein